MQTFILPSNSITLATSLTEETPGRCICYHREWSKTGRIAHSHNQLKPLEMWLFTAYQVPYQVNKYQKSTQR